MKAAFVVVVVVLIVAVQTIFLPKHLIQHLPQKFLSSSLALDSTSNRTTAATDDQDRNERITTTTHIATTMSPSFAYSEARKQQQEEKVQQELRNNASQVNTMSIYQIMSSTLAESATNTSNTRVQPGDFIYHTTGWNAAPIVLEEFNLVFFTVAKVGCTVWKKLFRRMMGQTDWRMQTKKRKLPHNPRFNGLRYLHQYSLENATHFMTSPNYTRAIFVRDPKERFLSAYLDKVLRNDGEFINKFCRNNRTWAKEDMQSISGFLNIVKTCNNEHWNPQAHRVDERFWPYINFVGHMENVAADAQRLLERVGAWERFGRNDWGPYQNESVFRVHSAGHTTGAAGKLEQYITMRDIEKEIDDFYADDYASPWLNLTKRPIPSLHNGNTNQVVIG